MVSRRLVSSIGVWLAAVAVVGCSLPRLSGRDRVLHRFERVELTGVYYSEGAGAGDIDGDGHVDVVYGPYWFAGPGYRERHEIYPPVAQPRERYADSFFSWVYDVSADGRVDVVAAGFPGTPAYVYENPGPGEYGRHWKKHQVLDWVSNESPQFTDLVGDRRPELVCTRDGRFGYATIDTAKPLGAWTFHAVSEQIAASRFGHGLGVGDVNGDGRRDIIHAGGWFEQPPDAAGAERWRLHEAKFTNAYGGADMYAYDVDGDGDNDVITSLAAHDFGLAWYEQVRRGGEVAFEPHLIMGDRPEQNRYGLVFSEPHSIALGDVDGDGLLDIVTGKTYYSHHQKSPLWNAGAVVYWFRLVRSPSGVDWVPYRADGESGIGRQLGVEDLDGDGFLDIFSGGMKGAHVLLQRRETVGAARWSAAQPRPIEGTAEQVDRAAGAFLEGHAGKVSGAIEGEALPVLRVSAGKVGKQDMRGFRKGSWSAGEQLYWTGGKPSARLELELEVKTDGEFEIVAVFTTARDYAIVSLSLDGDPLGSKIDLYASPDVGTTGELTLGTRRLAAGKHCLAVRIEGANPSAIPAHMFGLDYVRLAPKR